MTVCDPTLEIERELFGAGCDAVIGCDEVGRGAIAGPVTVAAAAIIPYVGAWPAGLRDSKMLSDSRRHALFEPVGRWVRAWSAASIDAERIDAEGIVACLRAAAVTSVGRVLRGMPELGNGARVAVILDGTSDWLSSGLQEVIDPGLEVTVRVRAKADRDCAVVAAASVLAKVERDDHMLRMAQAFPGYGWERNRGYGSPAHYEAIARLGATQLHRRSWLHASADRVK